MRNIIVASINTWNIESYNKMIKNLSSYNFHVVNNKYDLNKSYVDTLSPKYIFFPHWNDFIEEEIYGSYNCIVFHMTDLPYGRGGSPLQNLILEGFKNTKISAIKVSSELDAGDIYLKRELNLSGSANEIYARASKIIYEEMIPYIVNNNPKPIMQEGKPIYFKRRKPSQSELSGDKITLKKLYDFIRMLDADGYPNAFLKSNGLKFSFHSAKIKGRKLLAQVEIEEDK